ncbi:hypothetical protein [Bittarella massiliensis (ex Durand et al. 2017)]|uniref:Uncharacterized protein n=1 Tax=Bittarella massiliensis (ex Durand et al. 2017) TaxID=1720313 RepID=A0AAW5KH41_9FIRM|nr:hypothetical protein [Bittarella massiliensis (ex Durand et al. 2017)]MCQ4949843.1 hypothetical protein [Bittarella massiliensis (ex Durand et al. 2017)]
MEKLYRREEDMEFLMEPEVKEVLARYRRFLDAVPPHLEPVGPLFGKEWVKTVWRENFLRLAQEGYNSIVLGNFYSLGAINRSLIEFYVYSAVLCGNFCEDLWQRWLIDSLLRFDKTFPQEGFRTQCEECFADVPYFAEAAQLGKKRGEMEWLRPLFPNGKGDIHFRTVCEFLQQKKGVFPRLYQDYQAMCAFVHSGDLQTKCSPFAFYVGYLNLMILAFQYTANGLLFYQPPGQARTEMEAAWAAFFDWMDELLQTGWI